MTYDCMTPAELDAWREAASQVRKGGSTPCFDCPLWFAEEARSRDCCNRYPQTTGRPAYTTEERRGQWREEKRRQKAARKAA